MLLGAKLLAPFPARTVFHLDGARPHAQCPPARDALALPALPEHTNRGRADFFMGQPTHCMERWLGATPAVVRAS
jgi:hypothetical protein